MNSDKYSGSNPGQDYVREEEGDIWAKSGMPEYAELPEPDELTKLAHKVVIYGTVLAVVAFGCIWWLKNPPNYEKAQRMGNRH